jgi:FkbM family methyltransferase
MTIRDIVIGKLGAVRTLWRLWRSLVNWRPVWRAYRLQQSLPPLQFRRGFALAGGQWDSPVLMVHEVFCERMYTRELHGSPRGVILDLGANIGAVSLDFVSRWPELQIHAYEPNPETFKVLRQNVIDNGFANQVSLYHEAVAGTAGTFSLWTNVISVGSSGYSSGRPSDAATQVQVGCSDLAMVFSRAGGQPIYLLKIDVEGAECDILKASHGLSFDNVCNVAVECHDGLVPGALSKCHHILEQKGFRCKIKPVAKHAQIYMLYGHR